MKAKCPYCGTWSDTTAGHAAADCPMKPIDGTFTYPAEVVYQRRDELQDLRSRLAAAEADNAHLREGLESIVSYYRKRKGLYEDVDVGMFCIALKTLETHGGGE